MITKETKFEFIVAMGEGQLFTVKTVSDKLYSYALNRVRKFFPNQKIIIREVRTTIEYKEDVIIPANIDEIEIYEDKDDNGVSYTVVEGSRGSTGQYLSDDPKIQQLLSFGVKIKDGIDNRTKRPMRGPSM